jgi:hypothetical protein
MCMPLGLNELALGLRRANNAGVWVVSQHPGIKSARVRRNSERQFNHW